MVDTLTLHLLARELSHAERLALWSLRHLLRRDPPCCPALPHRLSWGFAADLARVEAGFQSVCNRKLPIHVGARASLSLSDDEALLLKCLARLQLGEDKPDESLAELMPEPNMRALLTEALEELAAALAYGGYWLTDPATLPVRPLVAAKAMFHAA